MVSSCGGLGRGRGAGRREDQGAAGARVPGGLQEDLGAAGARRRLLRLGQAAISSRGPEAGSPQHQQ